MFPTRDQRSCITMTEHDILKLAADLFRDEQGNDTLDTPDTNVLIVPNEDGTCSTFSVDIEHDKAIVDGEEHWLRPSTVDRLMAWADGDAEFPVDEASHWDDDQQFQVLLSLLMTKGDKVHPLQIIDKFVEADELAMSRGRHPSAH